MKKLGYKLLLAGALFIAATAGVAAQSKDAALNKRIVEEKNFVFVAQQALPARGRTIQLTGGYDFTMNGDSAIAYLPFFGRAFTAPYGGEGGIQFTSTSFIYNVVEKKNRWEISIKPNDASNIQQIYIDVSSNGYATMRVNSINRSPMAFTGYITEGKGVTKKAF
jgi:hypothetical protein